MTGAAVEADNEDAVQQGLGFFTTFLLVFAGVALFVGAFIIVNTFSMLIGQRARELALLRALGASRGQVLGSVLGEAAIVGVVGSALGIALGVLIAQGAKAAIRWALGVDIGTSLPITPRPCSSALRWARWSPSPRPCCPRAEPLARHPWRPCEETRPSHPRDFGAAARSGWR